MKDSSIFWRTLAPAVTLLLIIVSFFLLLQALNFPTESELIPVAKLYFQKYGLITVFFGALGEGLFLFGLYFPGTFIILLGVLLAAGNVAQLVSLWLVIIAGLTLSYSIDYILGKYGWYRLLVSFGLRVALDKARARLSSRGLSAIFTSFWQINIASLTATAAGILGFRYATFILSAVSAAAIWMAFWITVISALGPSALALVNLRFIIAVLIIWITWLAVVTWVQSRREKSLE